MKCSHKLVRFSLSLSIPLLTLLSLGLSVSHAGKGFSTQMFCDEGYGPQYVGCAQLTKAGDFKATLKGLPPNTPLSCYLSCELSGFSVDLPECGVTDQDGNLKLDYKNLASEFGGPCTGLEVTVYSPGELSCIQGFAKSVCDPPSLSDVGGGKKKARCSAGSQCQSPESCIAYTIDKTSGDEDTNDVNSIVFDPATHKVECRCKYVP